MVLLQVHGSNHRRLWSWIMTGKDLE
jgi:hypothetical protein